MTGFLLVAIVLIAAAVALSFLVRRVEPRLAFFPIRGQDETPEQYGVPFTALTITTADHERIHAWHLPRSDASAQVVYFHGNGGNLSLWSDVLVGLAHERFDVIAIDYRGYGLSTGQPSEHGLYRDVDATLQLVDERLRRRDVPLLYWGRSLGSTMAAYAASIKPPNGVVLESGFPSVRSVLETNPLFWLLSWAGSYQFPTARWMAHVRVPTLVLHGDRDSVIPYRLGERLYGAIPGPKRFVTIEGGDHNDPAPRDAQAYWSAVREFVESVR